jgi:DNA polymerase-4
MDTNSETIEKPRKIVHIDMDAFYASVEVLDRPELRGLPLVVGGQPGTRSVVCTASYEARKFGIRSAMATTHAAKLCPHAVFVPPRFERYKEISAAVRKIFERYTDMIEPLSLDEAYLDVTNHPTLLATQIAKQIREAVFSELGITCSAGVAPNKLVAKIASDMNKPNGITVVQPHQVRAFMEHLPLRKIHGVGPATDERLARRGFKICRDLWTMELDQLKESLGSMGGWIWRASQGIDNRPLVTSWERQSYGREDTLSADEMKLEHLDLHIQRLSEKVSYSLKKSNKTGRTITLKIKYSNFECITRSKSLDHKTQETKIIADICHNLLRTKTEAGSRPIRLVGVSVSNME